MKKDIKLNWFFGIITVVLLIESVLVIHSPVKFSFQITQKLIEWFNLNPNNFINFILQWDSVINGALELMFPAFILLFVYISFYLTLNYKKIKKGYKIFVRRFLLNA